MSNKNLSLIQVVRGIAVLLVVFFHATQLFHVIYKVNYLGGIFNEGRMGVDLFFVLSGFIIYYIHHKDRKDKNSAKKFFLKRFIRIFPVYWLILILLIPLYLMVPSIGIGETYQHISTHIKAFLLIPDVRPPLNVSWTLTQEVLFYLSFGAILFSKFKKTAIATFILWLVLSTATIVWVPKNYVILCLFYPTNAEFLYGLLVGYLVFKRHIKGGYWFILIGTVGSIFAMYNGIHNFFVINRMFSYGIPSAFLLLGCVSIELSKKVQLPRIYTYLGDASYSIYLIHFVAIAFCIKVFSKFRIFSMMNFQISISIVIVMAIMIGCLFHSFVEKRLLNYLRKKIIYRST